MEKKSKKKVRVIPEDVEVTIKFHLLKTLAREHLRCRGPNEQHSSFTTEKISDSTLRPKCIKVTGSSTETTFQSTGIYATGIRSLWLPYKK